MLNGIQCRNVFWPRFRSFAFSYFILRPTQKIMNGIYFAKHVGEISAKKSSKKYHSNTYWLKEEVNKCYNSPSTICQASKNNQAYSCRLMLVKILALPHFGCLYVYTTNIGCCLSLEISSLVCSSAPPMVNNCFVCQAKHLPLTKRAMGLA